MGPSVFTSVLIDALEAAGAEVAHVDTRDDRTVFNVGVLDLRNVALGLLHSWQLFRAALRPVGFVYVSISQERWGYVRDAVLLTVARVLRRRSVVQLHGASFQAFYAGASRPERWMIRTTLRWPELALVLTPALRGVFDGLVPAEKVRVLENGIPDPFAGSITSILDDRAERAAADPRTATLLYIANDFARKGGMTVVRALAEPGLERCRVRMIGAPPPEVAAATTELASELGVGDRVTLLGLVEGAPKEAELARADLFVYPTEHDAQPLVVLEAMAAGLPIVTSRTAGIPDTVGDCASLVDPPDAAAVAAAVRELIERPARRDELGRAARARYAREYTPERFRVRVREVFGDLLGGA